MSSTPSSQSCNDRRYSGLREPAKAIGVSWRRTVGRRPCPPRLQLLVITCCIILGWIGPPARAQEEPLVFGARQELKWLQLDPIEFTLDLIAQYQSDEVKQGGSTEKASATNFREMLTAMTSGYVLSPNVLELLLSGTAGLSQQFFDGGTESQNTNDTLYAWDVQARFFRNQPVSVTLYTQQSRQTVNRDFGPTLESTLTRYGAAIDLRQPKYTMRLHAFHQEEDQSSPINLENSTDNATFKTRQETLEYTGQYRFTDTQILNWQYTFNSNTQSNESTPSQSFDSQVASVSYSSTFGAMRQHNFFSTLEYQSQRGDLSQEFFRFDNDLRLHHTLDFETDYRYTFAKSSVSGVDRSNHRASAEFRHRLWESLTTSGQVGFDFQDVDNSEGRDFFANLSVDYTKKIPTGIIAASLSLGFDYQDNQARTDPIVIIDQAEQFGTQQPLGIILNRRNIDPRSIRLTDPAGLILYRPNLDYLVSSFSDRTEIRRVPTGLIPPAGNVLVDYTILPEAANTITTTSIGTGLRYTITEGWLNGLSVYGRYFVQNQDVQADNPDAFTPANLNDTVIGVEYRRGGLILDAEHEWHDSEIDPYQATRLSARYTSQIFTDTSLSLNATYSQIEYDQGETSNVDLLVVGAEVEHRLGRRWTAKLTLVYRDENDDRFGSTRGFDQLFEMRWRHRQTEIYMLLRNSSYEAPSQDSQFQFFQVGFRRYF